MKSEFVAILQPWGKADALARPLMAPVGFGRRPFI
jgi:hypothetical protein